MGKTSKEIRLDLNSKQFVKMGGNLNEFFVASDWSVRCFNDLTKHYQHLLHLSKYVSEMVLLHLLLNKNYKLTCICYIYVSKYVSEMHLLINTN